MTESDIVSHIQRTLSDAEVDVRDMTGGGDHYEIRVISRAFENLSLIERHRKMHEIMKAPMSQEVHAVKFKTLTPEEYKS